MKRAISLAVVIVLAVICFAVGTVAHAESQEVTLTAGGSLSDALTQVADGGKIVVDGTVSVTTAPGTHGKTVTITGGTLDFTEYSGNVYLNDHITFENITLTFKEATTAPAIYANGYRVKMGEGVTMPYPIRIFGGKNGTTTASTNLTLLSGYYTGIYGGCNNADITGDIYLYVGGNVNPDIDATSHNKTCCIHGGNYIPEGSSNTIGGSITTVFGGNAKANYLYGGNHGDGTGTVNGGIDVTVSGGQVMSVYGGSRGGSLTSDVKLLVSGGTLAQVLGGSEKGPVVGDVAVDITGGTVSRRVYGGCYNDYDSGWATAHYVTGEIVLSLHSGANIDFSSSSNDRAIYAHSRHSTLSDTEVSHLVYADATAYANYKDKVTAQDFAMQIIMGSTSAADHIHYHTYSASGAVITQSCIDSSCSATATLVVASTPAYVDTPVEPAEVSYSGSWFGGDLEITYTNNNAAGTGTASVTCGGATATLDFEITAADMVMNGQVYASLNDAVAAARQTTGADTITLLQDIEVSACTVINTDVTITANKAVTVTAADSQTGGMFRIVDGAFSIAGTSEDAKITLAAGKNTTHIISNNGGDVALTNVALTGNENTVYTVNNKTHGVFNYKGTLTAKSVDIAGIPMGDSVYVMDGTIVNLDNVTISGSGRYGIKVKGTLNISNTVCSDHALSVSGSADHAIDVESSGKVVCDFSDVTEGTYVIRLFENTRKGLNVRAGGDATLSYASGVN